MSMENDVEKLKREIVEALKEERWEEALSRLEVWCDQFPRFFQEGLDRRAPAFSDPLLMSC